MKKKSIQRSDFNKLMVPVYNPAPFIPAKGNGSRIWDQDDNEFIDFAGGIAVNALGHAHPIALDALTEQAKNLWHLGNGYTNEPVLKLAGSLTKATFADKVFFCNSGAEANEAALKLARKVARDNVYQNEAFRQLSVQRIRQDATLLRFNNRGSWYDWRINSVRTIQTPASHFNARC